MTCDRVVLSKFLEAVSTSAERNLLNNRTPISARFRHGVCGPVGNLLILCIRQECLHVMRMVKGHICANLLRIHLKCVPPLMKLGHDFGWRGTLTWTCCQMRRSTIEQNQKSEGLIFNLCRIMIQEDEISKFTARSPLTHDQSGLGFAEMQDGQVFTTCW